MVSDKDVQAVIHDEAWINSDACKNWKCSKDDIIYFKKQGEAIRIRCWWDPPVPEERIPIPAEPQMLDAIEKAGYYYSFIHTTENVWCIDIWKTADGWWKKFKKPTRYQSIFSAYKKVKGIE